MAVNGDVKTRRLGCQYSFVSVSVAQDPRAQRAVDLDEIIRDVREQVAALQSRTDAE